MCCGSDFLGLKFFKPVLFYFIFLSFVVIIIIWTKEIKNLTGLKNFLPRKNLNHNIQYAYLRLDFSRKTNK